jgi:iron complex outermembrane receptor protein
MKTTVLSLAALSALAVTLSASSVTLEALTVTSTPLGNTELDAPDSVEVYTADDIDKAHVRSLYEFINLQTSVIAMPSFGNPMAQKLDLHGYGIENGYQNIVITVNGRRLNNVDMVPQLLSAIAPADIERLEIIKSGGVVLGGDGANAGVINIVTKNDDTKAIRFYGGVYNTYDAAFRVGHSGERFSVSASGEAYHTAGTRHIDADQNRDEQKLANGTFDLSMTPIDALELRLGAQSARTDVNYGGPMTQAEYDENPAQPGSGYGWGPAPSQQRFDSDAYSAGITYDLNAHWSLNLDGHLEKKKSDYVTYGSVYTYDYRSLDAEALYTNGGVQVTLGADLFDGERDSGATSYSISNETTKKNAAGYALAQYRTGGHTFKAGYRYEDVGYDYSDANNSLDRSETLHGVEAGYNYRLSPERSLFVSYAHAYQAPDVDRFFNKDSLTGIVTFNGFIDPMSSDTVTAGYTAVTATNKFKASAYYTALHNEIYYYSDPGYVASANTNIDRSHKYGVDLYDQWMVSDRMSLSLNYNYVQAVIDEEEQNGEDFGGNDLPGVSNHNVKAALSIMPTDALTFTLSHTHRSSAYAMNDFGNNFSQRQQVYNSTDVSLTFAEESYELFAKINNMFDNANGLWVADDAIYPVNFTTTAIAGATLKF